MTLSTKPQELATKPQTLVAFCTHTKAAPNFVAG